MLVTAINALDIICKTNRIKDIKFIVGFRENARVIKKRVNRKRGV